MTLSEDARMRICIGMLMFFILTVGWAHYPINDSLGSLTPKLNRVARAQMRWEARKSYM